MKKFFKNLKNKIDNAMISAKVAMENNTAEGYVDTGVKIIIGVVIGGVILAGMYTLFNSTVIPTLTAKIQSMFSYAG